MTGTWPYRAVATSIYIYNTRHRLIRWLLSSRSMTFLFYSFIFGIVSKARLLLVARPSLPSVSKLARKSIKPALQFDHVSIERLSSRSFDDVSIYIYIYTSVVAWIFARRRKAVRKKDLLRRKENGSRCPFVERRSNKNRTRIDNWN